MKITKELEKAIGKLPYYSLEQFELDAIAYISAIRERRMCCIIDSVAKSGMSRTLKFASCEGSTNRNQWYWYRQYTCLFLVLGFSEVKHSGYFRIHGCGMDMVFDTNYRIIHKLKQLELITPSEFEKLAQEKPTVL